MARKQHINQQTAEDQALNALMWRVYQRIEADFTLPDRARLREIWPFFCAMGAAGKAQLIEAGAWPEWANQMEGSK